jgi:hypothetical protein
MTAASRLLLYSCGTGENPARLEAVADLPAADITDEGNRLLFNRAADEFFSLYAGSRVIVNAHRQAGFLEKAIAWLAAHPASGLTAAGRFSESAVEAAGRSAQSAGAELSVTRRAEPRLFKVRRSEGLIDALVPCAGFADEAEAFASCLAPARGVHGADCWTQLWKSDVLIPALEAGVRKREAFYGVARELARATGSGLNFSSVGRTQGVPGLTVREWAALLEELCVVQKLEALDLKPSRRTLDRPKLYWRHPGFGLWLSGEMIRPSSKTRRAFFENALFLALKDAYPQARFCHFADTNRVVCPLALEVDGAFEAWYVCENEAERLFALRHHRSIFKTGRFHARAAFVAFESLAAPARVSYGDAAAPDAAAAESTTI